MMQNYLDLTGKVALATGASSGIGAATALYQSWRIWARGVAIGISRQRGRRAEQVRSKILAAAGGSA